MSLCVCVQFPDRMILGSDTAVTFRISDGSKRRRVEPVQKSFIIGDTIVFLAGDAKTCFNIASEFDREKTKSITAFRRILKKHNRGLADRYSGESQDMPLNAVLLKMDQSGRTVSHTFLPSSHFNPVTRRGTDGGAHIVTGGFEADKVLTRALETWDDEKDVRSYIRDLFEEFAGGEIGGELDLFEFNVNGAHYLGRQRLNETPRFEPITAEETFALSAGLVGGTVTGALVRTATNERRIELDTRGFRAVDNAGRSRITIATDSDEGISGLAFFDPSGSWQGQLIGTSSNMTLTARDGIRLSGGTGPITLDSRVNFSYGIDPGVINGLNSALDNKAPINHTHNQYAVNMTFDSTTKNLKMYNQSGAVIATVNIG